MSYRDHQAEGWQRDAARYASALAEEVRRRRAAEAEALRLRTLLEEERRNRYTALIP